MDYNGDSLSEFPRPNLAVDAVILTVRDDQLCVVIDDRSTNGPALPGTFVHQGESLMDAVHRALDTKMHLSPITTFRQLHVFDAPGRDYRGWVMSVAHYALVDLAVLDDVRPKQIIPVDQLMEGTQKLAFDHGAMVRMAALKLREEYQEHPDPWDILGIFTLKELREFHEAIDRGTYLRDTFRRVMEPQLVLATKEDEFMALREYQKYPSLKMRKMQRPQAGRPSRNWRLPTEEERLMKRFAEDGRSQLKRSRRSMPGQPSQDDFGVVNGFNQAAGVDFALMSPAFRSRSDRSAADYSVEFFWSNSEPVRHANLREREAYRLFDDFIAAAGSLTSTDELRNRPVRAVLRNEYGEEERRIDLDI